MIRVALIGCGKTVRIGHAPALTALQDRFKVVAIADRSPEALDLAGTLFGVPPEKRYREYRDMLTYEQVDLVDIALPHLYHFEAARAALLAGAHIISERPLAVSLTDAGELLRLAEARGKLISVLHYLLYYPPFRAMIGMVRQGAIGNPFLLRCEGVTGGFGAGTETYHPDWYNNPDVAGGGVWMDNGYHSVYLCAAMMQSHIAGIAASIGTYNSDLAVDDTAVALLTHANTGMSSIQAAWSVPSGGHRVFEVYGTEGTLAVDHDGYPLGVYSNASQTWHHPHIEIGHAESFISFFTAVADTIQHDAPPPVSHRDALHTLDVVFTGYRAAEQGTTERIDIG